MGQLTFGVALCLEKHERTLSCKLLELLVHLDQFLIHDLGMCSIDWLCDSSN